MEKTIDNLIFLLQGIADDSPLKYCQRCGQRTDAGNFNSNRSICDICYRWMDGMKALSGLSERVSKKWKFWEENKELSKFILSGRTLKQTSVRFGYTSEGARSILYHTCNTASPELFKSISMQRPKGRCLMRLLRENKHAFIAAMDSKLVRVPGMNGWRPWGLV